MKLIRFELLKLVTSRGFGGMAAVLLVVSLAMGYFSAEEPNYNLQAVETVVEDYKEDPAGTLEQYRALEKEYQAFLELLLSEELTLSQPPDAAVRFEEYKIAFDRLFRQERYTEALLGALRNLKKQSASAEGKQGVVNRYLAGVYERNLSLRLGDGSIDGLQGLYSLIASLYLPLMLFGILLGVTAVYSQRERGTELLIRAAWKGRGHASLAKAFACATVCGAGCASAMVSAVVAYSFKSGFCGFSEYIQAHDNFMLFPIPLTVAESLLILFLLIFTGCLLVCGVACLLGKYCGNRVFPLAGASLLLLQGFLPESPDAGSLLRILPLSRLFDGNRMFAHLYPVVMGETPLYGGIAVGAGYLGCLLLIWGLYVSLPGRALEISRASLSLPKIARRHTVGSVTGYEWKKQLLANKALWLLLGATVLKAAVAWNAYVYDPTYTQEKYRSYMTSIQGPYTEAKREGLEQELNALYETLGNRSLMEKRYRAGEISREEMGQYLSAFYEAEHNEKALAAVKERLDALQARQEAGQAAYVVYDAGWELLLSPGADLLLLILAAGACCGLYSDEHKRGMHRLYALCPVRALSKAKLSFCCGFTLVGALLFRGIDLLAVGKCFSLPLGTAPACGIGGLPFMDNAPLWAGYAATVLLCFLYGLAASAVAFLLSRLTKNKGAAFLLSLALLLPLSVLLF